VAQIVPAEIGDFGFAACRCEYAVDEVVGIHRRAAFGAGEDVLVLGCLVYEMIERKLIQAATKDSPIDLRCGKSMELGP
jgi:hypothetical protein